MPGAGAIRRPESRCCIVRNPVRILPSRRARRHRASAVAGLLVAATIALWVHYGTAVFYEMILTGIAACF
jgi:hypothetical protein